MNPLLYEINTRCWLQELSQRHGRAVTLASVPDAEFAFWQGNGFTHLWLIGVWSTGARARMEALNHADLAAAYTKILPDWQPQDVSGSPYAIADYHVPAALGGDNGLKIFREQLNAIGIRLILDFVPNHLAMDHPWVTMQPELFVQSKSAQPGTFQVQTSSGTRWLANGKDPYFAPWTDTVQLDYRRADTWEVMRELLQSVAARCDGVRCDMAMLLLSNIFPKTWEHLPALPGRPAPVEEFWMETIASLKAAHPGFLFLAEVYWGLDGYMQTLGFDYTYDKHLYDRLLARDAIGIHKHLIGATPRFVQSSAHFLENHDEERIAPRLSPEEHRAAALLILGLPGMRFLHEGQLTGARAHIPVQLGRRPQLPADPKVVSIYGSLLSVLRKTAVGQKEGKILKPTRAWADNPTSENFIIVQWMAREQEFELVVVNLAPHRSQCFVTLRVERHAPGKWRMNDLLGEECYHRYTKDLEQGLYFDVPGYAAQLFRFQPL